MNIKHVGNGEVILIAGGGNIYTDIAARFVGSEKCLKDIIASPYDSKIVSNIITSNHKAALEFDYFLFGVQGYARVTEIQLVRKRIASYMIKSGRINKEGKRSFDVVVPESICWHNVELKRFCPNCSDEIILHFDLYDLLNLIEGWYNKGIDHNIPEEELRYLKPQATEFKAIIGMNAHALLDWFQIRLCKNAQEEIRDMAKKMLILCKNVAPDLFESAGASCKHYGYCPENKRQHIDCRIIKKDEAIMILKNHCGEVK